MQRGLIFSKGWTSIYRQEKPTIVEIVLWNLDSGCSKHITGQRDKLINLVSKFIGTVRFGNDRFAAIMGYRDLHLGNILISRVYYIEGLGHNLFSVRQFCDSDLEVAFRKHTCFIRNLEGVDLLSGSYDSNLYAISLKDMMNNAPSKKDLDILFQLIFNEYFKPLTSDLSSTISAATLLQHTTGETSSIPNDQDAPSLNNPLVTIIGNPSKPVSARRQLATDAMWCYFYAFLTKVEPKNYKEAMEESRWIKAIQEEIHESE
ncbi:hypothetical protein Tco_1152273 [Tanacetum coccineum]